MLIRISCRGAYFYVLLEGVRLSHRPVPDVTRAAPTIVITSATLGEMHDLERLGVMLRGLPPRREPAGSRG